MKIKERLSVQLSGFVREFSGERHIHPAHLFGGVFLALNPLTLPLSPGEREPIGRGIE